MKLKTNIGLLMVAAAAVTSCLLLVPMRYVSVFSTNIYADREAWGQFGDYFGGVLNPLLSFAAFIALLINLYVQLKSNDESKALSVKQVREQRLFQLLDMVRQNSLNLKYRSPGDLAETLKDGHVGLHHAWQDFSKILSRGMLQCEVAPMLQYESVVKDFWIFKRNAWPSISVFVQSFYLLLDFIYKNQSLEDQFTQFSMGVAKAQLTDEQRTLLWYCALCDQDYTHHLYILRAFGFVVDNEHSVDPLRARQTELMQCALAKARLIF